MSEIRDVQDVKLVGIAGHQARESIRVNVLNREIPRGTHVHMAINSVTSLNPPVDNEMGIKTKAYITVEGEVRYRLDGHPPSSIMGHLVKDGGVIKLDSIEEIKGFRVINIGDNANIQISYKLITSEW